MSSAVTPAARERTPRPLWLEVLLRVAISVTVVAVLTHLVVRPFRIPSQSMEPTLQPGDRVVTRILGVDAADLDRGTVIAFAHGQTWSQDRLPRSGNPLVEVVRTAGDIVGAGPSHADHTVKRIIGRPGETVRCCDAEGRVEVDGVSVDEPYVRDDIPFAPGTQDCTTAAPSVRCFPELTVPADSYLVLGDNRASSADSVLACRGRTEAAGSCAKYVRSDQVVGVVAWRLWPLPPGGVD